MEGKADYAEVKEIVLRNIQTTNGLTWRVEVQRL